MYSVPFILLTLTLLLPIVTPRLFHGLDSKAHARQKRAYPQSQTELEKLVEGIQNQKTQKRNELCIRTQDGRCVTAEEILANQGPAQEVAAAFLQPPQIKKECTFSLGNHCLTKMLDNKVTSLNYLQSGSSPGRRRRRRRRRHLARFSPLPRVLLA